MNLSTPAVFSPVPTLDAVSPLPHQSSEALSLNGLTVAESAALLKVTEADVWSKLRRGELVGRTNGGRLLIYDSPAAIDLVENSGAGTLPPLPTDGEVRAGATVHEGSHLAPKPEPTELALLLDHLSLAKEENREILRMTQESIRKVTSLSDALIEMKDSVIDAKDTVIVSLRNDVSARDQEIRKLKQQVEDLEMLARATQESREL